MSEVTKRDKKLVIYPIKRVKKANRELTQHSKFVLRSISLMKRKSDDHLLMSGFCSFFKY